MDQCLSVIITTYQRDIAMVLRAVESVKQQTYSNIEILLIDDNPDGNKCSETLKATFTEESGIRYIKQDGNKGACVARNLGIKMAKGYYVAFLDDDDTWEPNKAKRQIERFQEGDDTVGMVYCLGDVIDSTVTPPEVKEYYTTRFFKPEVTYLDLLRGDIIGSTSQAMIKKSCIKEVGGFNKNLPARQDYEMWIRISKHYRILGVNEKLFHYYQHEEGQITKSYKKAITGYRLVYRYYKEDFNKDYLAKINILERMMDCCKGSNELLFWYYRFYKHFTINMNKLKKYLKARNKFKKANTKFKKW